MTSSGHAADAPVAQRLLLLRHGHVASHRGDIPITAEGVRAAANAGRAIAASSDGPVLVLSGSTLRARQTAQAFADHAREAGARVTGPRECGTLRNPDLFLTGVRVDMVSTLEAFAAQVPGLTEEDVAGTEFFAGFVAAPDRIGWWLRHPDPPGEDPRAVTDRVAQFARSLTDFGEFVPEVTVAVTHSPVIRACGLIAFGADPGEPDWLGGLRITVRTDRSLNVEPLESPAVR